MGRPLEMYRVTLTVLGLVLVTTSAGKAVPTEARVFTLIEVPGNYHHPALLSAQVEWAIDQADRTNVLALVHTGDLVKDNTETEWSVVNKALSPLEGKMPYLVAAGNHETFPGKGKPRVRDMRAFNKHLPLARFAEKPWYGGSFAQGSENIFFLLHAHKMKLLILSLEFAPRETVLEWANQVVARYRDHLAIVVTHAFTYAGESRANFMWHPLHVNKDCSDRAEVWDRFVRKHANIRLVLSGHYLGQRRETSLGDKGNHVHETLANYLQEGERDAAWMRILTFIPDRQCVEVRTYSPILERYATDERNQFELSWAAD